MSNTNFVNAMLDWTREKDKFVSEQLSTGTNNLSPRKNIMLTVPLEFEDEIKAFAKSKRKEADENYSSTLDVKKIELSIAFEKENPPPRAEAF